MEPFNHKSKVEFQNSEKIYLSGSISSITVFIINTITDFYYITTTITYLSNVHEKFFLYKIINENGYGTYGTVLR